MKKILQSIGLAVLFVSPSGCFQSKPQPWTEKDIEAYAGVISIPNTFNNSGKIGYHGILWDLDDDGKIDLVANEGHWTTFIVAGYEEKARHKGLMVGKTVEYLEEKTREDLTKIYTVQKEVLRNYMSSRGLYKSDKKR